MNIVQRIYPVGDRKPTVKQAVAEKMKVLREFHVVDKCNEAEVKAELLAAIKAHPESDYEIVLDRVAHQMISEKLK